jgi:hypothetical protein
MNIKKTIGILPLFIILAATSPAKASSTFAASKPIAAASIVNDDSLKIEQMKMRLAEIQSMDPSTMSASDKKDVKRELIAMKKEATAMQYYDGGGHGGLYISVGALIIIILLLILIF